MLRRVVENRLRGIESQAIEMILTNPIGCVCGNEFAHWPRLHSIKVDRFTPIGGMAVGKVVRRKRAGVIARWAEVVVDDVENNANFECVGSVDKGSEIVGRSI